MPRPLQLTCLACLLAAPLASVPLRAQSQTADPAAALPVPPLPEVATTAAAAAVPATTPTAASASTTKKEPALSKAAVSSIEPTEIEGFESYPAPLQKLITEALALTRLNLRYTFGSANPKAGGMDCSGTIYHLLRDAGVDDIPRQSDQVCSWVMKQSILYRTENVGSLKDKAFSALKPGDLLFWTGTYQTAVARDLPVTHVMIYLGKRKANGKPVIFGASEGRSFDGLRRNGVSVFDFPLPRPESPSDFYGYGSLPSDAWDEIRKS